MYLAHEFSRSFTLVVNSVLVILPNKQALKFFIRAIINRIKYPSLCNFVILVSLIEFKDTDFF